MKSMSTEELILKMGRERNNFNPPLSIMEILDFAYHRLPDQDEWEKQWDEKIAKKQAVDNATNRLIKLYKTKSGIKQLIKEENEYIDRWMIKKRESDNEADIIWYEIIIEEAVAKKEELKKRLKWFGFTATDNNNLQLAKQAPIENYIDFKGGFAKCLWHNERTPSMKHYPNKNKVHCFSGCGSKDVVDAVQQIHNVDLPGAIKIILNI